MNVRRLTQAALVAIIAILSGCKEPCARYLAVGAGPGAEPEIKVYSVPDYKLLKTILPYDSSFTGGVNVALMDLDKDGYPDVIAAPASQGGTLSVFDGHSSRLGQPMTSSPLNNYTPFQGNVSGLLLSARTFTDSGILAASPASLPASPSFYTAKYGKGSLSTNAVTLKFPFSPGVPFGILAWGYDELAYVTKNSFQTANRTKSTKYQIPSGYDYAAGLDAVTLLLGSAANQPANIVFWDLSSGSQLVRSVANVLPDSNYGVIVEGIESVDSSNDSRHLYLTPGVGGAGLVRGFKTTRWNDKLTLGSEDVSLYPFGESWRNGLSLSAGVGYGTDNCAVAAAAATPTPTSAVQTATPVPPTPTNTPIPPTPTNTPIPPTPTNTPAMCGPAPAGVMCFSGGDCASCSCDTSPGNPNFPQGTCN